MTQIEKLSKDTAGEMPSADEFPSEWYALASDEHFWFAWRHMAFMRLIRDLGLTGREDFLGLDIGCGSGVNRRQIERDTLWRVDGADLNARALADNPSNRSRTFFYDIHDRHPALKEAYDFIILFDVIEHIEDTRPFLESSLYHLKKGGWLFVNVPALASLMSNYDKAAGHFRRYDTSLMCRELDLPGVRVSQMRYWGWFNVPLLKLRKQLSKSYTGDQNEIIRRGFKPPSLLVNRLFKTMARLETNWLPRPPVGTSLLAAAIKTVA